MSNDISWFSNHWWIIVVLLSQLAWAVGNYVDRYLLSRYKPDIDDNENLGVGTLLLFSSFFGVVSAGIIYLVANTLPFFGYEGNISLIMPTVQIMNAMFIGVLEVVWLVPYFYALAKADETEVVPIFQSIPIFGLILGLTFFGEMPLLIHLIGSLVVICGALILTFNIKKYVFDAKVLFLMLLVSFIVATSTVLFKYTALEENYWSASFWMSIGTFLTGIIIYLTFSTYRQQFNTFLRKKDWLGVGINASNEFVNQIAILAFYLAVVLGPSVMVVQSTTAYQPVFVLVIGIILARLGSNLHVESLSGGELIKKVIGVAVILIGSFLIFS